MVLRRAPALALSTFVLSSLVAWPARADTVRLNDGTRIEGVRATIEGDRIRVARELGSSTIPARDVAEIVTDAEWRDRGELERRRRAAGQDPIALRGVAAWCEAHGFPAEARDLVALARGISLDRRLEALARARDVDGYVELAAEMRADGHAPAECVAVLEKALALAPESLAVRRALGQERRHGEWVSRERAAEIDAAEDARSKEARGLVAYDGCWRTPGEVAAIEAQKASVERARERREWLAERIAAIDAAKAEAARCRARREYRRDRYFLAAMPSYRRDHR